MARFSGANLVWFACVLVLATPFVLLAWAVLTTGDMIHPIDVRLAMGPGLCLSMSILGLIFALRGLTTRPTPGVQVVLWLAIVAAICEVPAFAILTVGVALGIGAPA